MCAFLRRCVSALVINYNITYNNNGVSLTDIFDIKYNYVFSLHILLGIFHFSGYWNNENGFSIIKLIKKYNFKHLFSVSMCRRNTIDTSTRGFSKSNRNGISNNGKTLAAMRFLFSPIKMRLSPFQRIHKFDSKIPFNILEYALSIN